MTTGREQNEDGPSASLLDALLVYVEPLASGAHAVVVGDSSGVVAERLLELGARAVHVFDPDDARAFASARRAPRGVTVRPLGDGLDVRDGAFDIAVVPDLAELREPRRTIARLRRAVALEGAVVALGRAKVEGGETEHRRAPFAGDLGTAALGYAELYDLFATAFDDVALVGVVPFRGVVFAALGTEDESPSVSVDTRLAAAEPPSVFVVVASNTSDEGAERASLDPYAIVQVPDAEPDTDAASADADADADAALDSAFAALQLRVEVLSGQLNEARDGLVVADVRSVEIAARLDRATAERDSALTRAMELEAVLVASQQALGTLERRLASAERGMLDRDDRLATLSAELDAKSSTDRVTAANALAGVEELVDRAERAEAALALALVELSAREPATMDGGAAPDPALLEELERRVERAETALALNVADIALVSEAHSAEMADYESQLRSRAQVVADLERELARREQLVKELVGSLEEAREGTGEAIVFESAAPMSMPAPRRDPALEREAALLREKLDLLSAEVARQEGELTARAWRITELENDRAGEREPGPTDESALRGAYAETHSDAHAEAYVRAAPTEVRSELAAELDRARDELDALRQALAQEHAARLEAESLRPKTDAET